MTTGTELYDQIDTLNGTKREHLLLNLFTTGNVLPPCLTWVPVVITGKNKTNPEQEVKIEYQVLSDYLAAGTNEDYFRLPLAPTTAQKIADYMSCLLPTKKMVDQIWQHATIKLTPKTISPKPGEAGRESSITFRRHNRMVEDQLKGKVLGGIVAGHKKDVIITNKLTAVKNKVAIYGWQYSDGRTIQPVYTGHGSFYADYSHGIRLVKKACKVNDVEKNLEDVLKDKDVAHLLSDEGVVKFTRY